MHKVEIWFSQHPHLFSTQFLMMLQPYETYRYHSTSISIQFHFNLNVMGTFQVPGSRLVLGTGDGEKRAQSISLRSLEPSLIFSCL